MNSTLEKFGYPATLIRQYSHWCVLLRSAQATLASLILATKGEEKSFSGLRPEAFAELGRAVKDTEQTLKTFRSYDRVNYLMLMMVDPHVHFHVLPRYSAPQTFNSENFLDPGWPGLPDLKSANGISSETQSLLLHSLRQLWPKD